ncbi:hypothetical protein [Nocardia arizonensis]|uniref:hypothetical protein n=1 Tax=Nocardia arizonensis TaxID=1141647 RepID=UPI0006D0299D|nr:hypothetical protein [Nocardia arizonensis]
MPFVIAGGTVPFTPTSMTKNGAWQMTIPGGGVTWYQVPSWTAETGAYPGSVVVGNALQVSSDKAGATVQASLPFSGGTGGSTKQQARLLVDGVVVATGSQVTGVSGTLTVSATVDVSAGSAVTVETTTDASLQSWAASVTATTGYVRIT